MLQPKGISGKISHGHKLRLLGLTDPQKALKEAGDVISGKDILYNAMRITSNDTLGIIGKSQRDKSKRFGTPVILLRQQGDTEQLIQNAGLRSLGKKAFFSTTFSGYSFGHDFLVSAPKWKGKSLSTVYVDSHAIDKTTEEVGEDDFKVFEKALSTLFLYANHDETIHNYGLNVEGDTSGMNSFLEEKFKFDFPKKLATRQEIFSTIFHKDIFNETCEKNPKLYESLKKNCMIVIGVISKIKDSNLQNYWKSLITYPLYSLIDPFDLSPGTIGKAILELQPEFHLPPNQWSQIIHGGVRLNNFYDKSNSKISVKGLKKVVLEGFSKDEEAATKDIVDFLCRELGYEPIGKSSGNVSNDLWLSGYAKEHEIHYQKALKMWNANELADEYMKDLIKNY